MPELGPSSLGEDKLDVTFKVEEQNRNQFTFGGGVSGLEGTFINAQLLDRELPGPGRDLPDLRPERARAPRTTRSRSPSPTSSTGPSPPASTSSSGSSPTRRFTNVVGYTRGAHGGQLHDRPAHRPPRFNRAVRELLVPDHRHRGPERAARHRPRRPRPTPTQPVFDPFFFGEEGRRKESTHQPVLRPQHRGQPLHSAQRHEVHRSRPQFAGGPLGGTVNYFKPDAEFIWYIPHFRQDGPGHPRGGGLDHAVRRHPEAARTTSASSWAARRRSAA